jgi:hypothetical protein
MLVQAAHNAKNKRGSFYRSKYNKLKFKLGSANKAKVAIANRLARSIYKVLAGDAYKELGYLRGDPKEDQVKQLVQKLRSLGVQVFHHKHQTIVSKEKLIVDDSGVIVVR